MGLLVLLCKTLELNKIWNFGPMGNPDISANFFHPTMGWKVEISICLFVFCRMEILKTFDSPLLKRLKCNILTFPKLKCFISVYWTEPKHSALICLFPLGSYNSGVWCPYPPLWARLHLTWYTQSHVTPIMHHAAWSEGNPLWIVGDVVFQGAWPKGEDGASNYSSHKAMHW